MCLFKAKTFQSLSAVNIMKKSEYKCKWKLNKWCEELYINRTLTILTRILKVKNYKGMSSSSCIKILVGF